MSMRIVYPALFEWENETPITRWFRLLELTASVHSIFQDRKCKESHGCQEFMSDYWLLSSAFRLPWTEGIRVSWASRPGDIILSHGQTCFVPEGWGNAVITAVTRGVRSVTWDEEASRILGQGINREGEFIAVDDLVWKP